jgi:diguanylate cyclase (GGDEF)-like protein
MERARLACASNPVASDSGEFDVTISLGAAVVHDFEDVDLAVVLKTADHALYRAKEGGRNRFEVESV